MVAEIDLMSVNVNLSRLLNIELRHFNDIEAALIAALQFDIGVSEDKFKAKFDSIDKLCSEKWSSDSVKMAALQSFSTSPETPSQSPTTSHFLVKTNSGCETEQDDFFSEETKTVT